jgi:[ribosomal protein S5]-alanine N-acetyltransferase
MEIQTTRLRLLNCNVALLEQAIAGDAAFAAAIQADITPNWTQFGQQALEYVLSQLQVQPEQAPWWTWFPILRNENRLVGSGGFTGPPQDGLVEIGYEIAASERGKGLATEYAKALLRHAFAQPEIERVQAHTLAQQNASTAVLQHCGMQQVATLNDPEEGEIWRWEIGRRTFEAQQAKSAKDYPLHLTTARLYTRALQNEDAEVWESFLADPVATQYFPDPAGKSPQLMAKQWIQRQMGRYADQHFGLLALIHKESGAFIGQCGLIGQLVNGQYELEVGYHVLPQYWRQGYAIEAAQAFRDLAFERGWCDTLISLIHQENLPSQAVALRNGMQRTQSTEMVGLPIYIYRIDQAAWAASQTIPQPPR